MTAHLCSCGRHRADCAYPSTFTHEDIMTTDTIQPGQGRDDADLDRHIVSLLIGLGIAGTVLLVAAISWIIQG